MESKRIVVDTSIARASGPPNSIKPISSHCRDFLLAIREICHKIVFTNDILDEWNKHQSKFAASWRVSMKSKSKTILLKGSALKKLSRDSRKNIELINSSEAEAIKKDALLLEAAKSWSKFPRLQTITSSIILRMNAEYRKTTHTIYNLQVHIAWITNGTSLREHLAGKGKLCRCTRTCPEKTR